MKWKRWRKEIFVKRLNEEKAKEEEKRNDSGKRKKWKKFMNAERKKKLSDREKINKWDEKRENTSKRVKVKEMNERIQKFKQGKYNWIRRNLRLIGRQGKRLDRNAKSYTGRQKVIQEDKKLDRKTKR